MLVTHSPIKQRMDRNSEENNTSIAGNSEGTSRDEENNTSKALNFEGTSKMENNGKHVVTDGNQTINAASLVKLPAFWRDNPSLWFVQVECAFALSKIQSDETKFRYVVLHLDSDALSIVSDILISSPSKGKYQELKNRIINSYEESNESKLRRLLKGREIGDEKPSKFLQQLRNEAGGQCNDTVLKTLFLEQLPENIRAVLAISDTQDLGKLALQADKITEMIRPSIIMVETNTAKNNF
ncbi:hypothetical protein KPH14_001015 [Odynerus spinipes]|uniref:DUF7041 domain-containing protein n=1 Tax=Odynerus spinipes TaxID=1348599 RepID=A0AAD9VJJ9_9HYME|nr:hypothetical protein KPH14_001015 [Odynerus spinipes]